MRSYVGIAVETEVSDNESDELLGLEFDGFREVDLGEDKLKLILLRWSPDGSPLASFLKEVEGGAFEEEDRSD